MTDGISIEINQAEVERQARALAALSVEHPEIRKKIRKEIQRQLTKARSLVSRDTKGAVPNDPRQAYKAVRRAVWKKVLGGSINILSQRKAGQRNLIEPPRKLRKGQRGGNRVPRSQRTTDLMSYFGKDRGFILRFLNSGTDNRQTRLGNRGSITPRWWFRASAETALDIAADNLGKMIEEEMARAFSEEQGK